MVKNMLVLAFPLYRRPHPIMHITPLRMRKVNEARDSFSEEARSSLLLCGQFILTSMHTINQMYRIDRGTVVEHVDRKPIAK